MSPYDALLAFWDWYLVTGVMLTGYFFLKVFDNAKWQEGSLLLKIATLITSIVFWPIFLGFAIFG